MAKPGIGGSGPLGLLAEIMLSVCQSRGGGAENRSLLLGSVPDPGAGKRPRCDARGGQGETLCSAGTENQPPAGCLSGSSDKRELGAWLIQSGASRRDPTRAGKGKGRR